MMDEKEHTLHEFFTKDHRRLDKLFNRFRADDSASRIEILNMFAAGLIRHIIWEEEYLFPIFERVTGMVQEGPIVVMREDHHTIQELLYELLMQAKEGEISSTLPVRLEGLLLQHNQAEENVLYEAVESMLAPESRTELLQTLMEEGELDIEEWIEGVSIIEGQSEDESDSDEEVSDSDCSNPVSLH